MNPQNNQEQNIKLGGFPPIYYLSNEGKKKREFKEKMKNDDTMKNVSNFNILNIKNILGKK